jgi:hypothetical protein
VQRGDVGDRGQRRQCPAERVAADRDRQDRPRRDRGGPGQLLGGVGEQQVDLPGGPDQGRAGRRRAYRPAANQQNLPGGGLERAQPLAHRRRRHVQHPRGAVEAAVIDDRRQGAELVEIEIHMSQANAAEVPQAGLQKGGCLP